MTTNQAPQNKGYKIIKTDTGDIKLSPQIIRQYLVSGNGNITDQECMMFLALCEGQKLNPFTKDVYLIKFGNSPATMVVSKDVFLKRAVKNKDFNGMESGVIVVTPDYEIKHLKGGVYLKQRDMLIGAWAKVYRKSWNNPIYTEVNFDEYVGTTSTGEVNKQWKSKPATMILKVAETHALRKAFVDDMQGMYIEDEMNVKIENTVPHTPIPSVAIVEQEPVDEIEQVFEEVVTEEDGE